MESRNERAGRADTIIIITGGDALRRHEVPPPPRGAFVIAADSGIDHAHRLGVRVDLAVGDFDSVTPAALRSAERAGAAIERHPEAKDATDLELAVDAAVSRLPERIVILGGHGGRLDHLLANALLLGSARTAGIEVVAHLPPATVTVVRSRSCLRADPGDVVTLLPIHGPVRSVTTAGLLYPLRGEDLEPGSTRGVSNEMAEPTATVTVGSGTLLVIQPGTAGTHLAGRSDRRASSALPERGDP